MANGDRKFQHSKDFEDTSSPVSFGGESNHSRLSGERIDALNNFHVKTDEIRNKFEKVEKFINDNKDRLEKRPFFQRFQENLQRDLEGFTTLQREVSDAEEAGKSTGGGLSIEPLK